MLDKVKKILNDPTDDKLFIVDVGCHMGHFRDELFSLINKQIYIIGIDPLDFGVSNKYDKYIRVAIANVDIPTTKKFYEYCEPGCSSLLKMNTDIITHNEQESKKGWFVPWEIETVIRDHDVVVASLESILDSLDLNISIIHMIKIDTQGMDMRVVKSLRHYLPKVALIQIESVTTHNPEIVLYRGQHLLEQDIEEMNTLGFTILDIDYHKDKYDFKLNEADVVFFNSRIITNETI